MKSLHLKITAANDYELQMAMQQAYRKLMAGKSRFEELRGASSSIALNITSTADGKPKALPGSALKP
jgi:hypothetical protein